MKYKIGEVAKLLGISPDLLRYYEKKGVVSPEKGEFNDYRYYDSWDINFLMDCLWFKNFGFSIDQISHMVRNTSAEDITAMFLSKEQELEAAIRRSQLLLLRSREYRQDIEKLSQLGKFNVADSPAGAFYLNRYGDEYASDPAPLAHKWLEVMPFNHRYFQFSEGALRGQDPNGYQWGYFLSDSYVKELKLEVEAPMKWLAPERSLHTVCKSSGKGRFGAAMLSPAVEYAKQHGIRIKGPAKGTLLASLYDENELSGYFEVWIPIE